MRYFFIFSFSILSFFIVGSVAYAQTVPNAEHTVLPCGYKELGGITRQCTVEDIFKLVNNVINLLIFQIASPLAALVLMYSGFQMLISGGDSSKYSAAKNNFMDVVTGFALILSAWAVVSFILSLAAPAFVSYIGSGT